MRRFVNGDRYWEIAIDGKFVVTTSGVAGKPPKVERRFCKDGAAAYLAERVKRRRAEVGWVEDRARVHSVVAAPAPVARPTPPPRLREDADRAVGAELVRRRTELEALAARAPEAEQAAVAALLAAAPAVPPLDPACAAALLSACPTRAAADLVVGRGGLTLVVDACVSGAWLGRSTAPAAGPRAKRELPAWLTRARELATAAPDLEAARARARAAGARPEVAGWRLVDAAFATVDGALAADLLARWPGGVPAELAHVAADLDPEGWLALLATPMGFPAVRKDLLAPWLAGLVAREGAAALAVPWVAEDLELVRRIPHPDAARVLIARLAKPPKKPTLARPDAVDPALTALRGMPSAALAALAADGAHGDVALALASELAALPGQVDALLPTLDAAGQRRLRRWAADAPLPDATEVPPALQGRLEAPLPRWVVLGGLPPLVVPAGDAVLPAAARAKLLEVMARSPDFAFDAVQDVARPESFAAFTLALFDQYLAHAEERRAAEQAANERSAQRFEDDELREHVWVRRADTTVPDEDRWILRAVSVFGDGDSARGLAERIRKLPGSMWQLSAQVVDALGGIRHPTAAVELASLAQRGPTGASKRARLVTGQLPGAPAAASPPARLPDLGLDPDGTLLLDFGPRQFRVGFDADLAPIVRDAAGAAHRTLPRARASDDAPRAAAAAERWAALRRDAKKAASALRAQLEGAMRRRRTWSPAQWQEGLASHPFARHVVSRLLWSTPDGLFRVDEGGRPVNVDSDPVGVAGPVTLVHPVRLAPADLEAWRQVFVDFELTPPFEQLTRAVHRPDPATDAGSRLPRLVGATFQRGRLFALRDRGWRWLRDRDEGTDEVVGLSGDWVAPPPQVALEVGADTVRVADVQVAGSWTALDPVAFSEVVRDLASSS